MNSKHPAPVALAFFAAVLSGCNEHAPLRESTNAQNSAFTQSKMSELATAAGVYLGKIHINRSNVDYDCVLTVRSVLETTRGSAPDQPSETVEVPKLSASLTFPILDGAGPADFPRYADLIDPMGRFLSVLVDYGNYNASTRVMTLPYAVSGYPQGNFGELTGTVANGHFVGSWNTKPLGTVGSFDLAKR